MEPTIAVRMPPVVTLMGVSLVHAMLASMAMVGLAQVYSYILKNLKLNSVTAYISQTIKF